MLRAAYDKTTYLCRNQHQLPPGNWKLVPYDNAGQLIANDTKHRHGGTSALMKYFVCRPNTMIFTGHVLSSKVNI